MHVLTDEELARPRNRIQFTGNVAMPALHEWVGGVPCDVTDVTDATD